ncbi:uncharacterized protein LOC115587599 isoform X2 [Sparus aurata]|uniref:uncharacterized protein LOC115587599 isoform X2 n=1 Tax=Sparus aurata TaxID=8175 RepID=UPI0011C0FC98|nr:uncharacterized protein LOC115587599 isoform X2 [Sparus aurata]
MNQGQKSMQMCLRSFCKQGTLLTPEKSTGGAHPSLCKVNMLWASSPYFPASQIHTRTMDMNTSMTHRVDLATWLTVQRYTEAQSRRSSTSTTYQDSPKRKREVLCIDKQLLGEHCHEAISFLKHSTDESAIKEKMRATFQYRQTLVQDQQCSSTVFDVFPRFLDITGLIEQDITMMFGEEVSGRFLAKWPSFFKPRILTDCKKLTSNEHIEDLVCAARLRMGQ